MFGFPTPEELQKLRADDKARGDKVRMMADASDKVEAGNFYTVTPSFSNGDGSWVECFWEVLTVNGTRVFVRIHDRFDREPNERFWDIEDRAWYLANDAWEAKTTGGTSD